MGDANTNPTFFRSSPKAEDYTATFVALAKLLDMDEFATIALDDPFAISGVHDAAKGSATQRFLSDLQRIH